MDLILKNAKVMTMDTAGSEASAVAVKWGKICSVGKDADIVVLDQHITAIPPEQIADAQVLMTIVDGRIVYLRP